MAALTTEEKRAKRAAQLFRNIEAQIMMCDDSDDLMILGTLFLSSAKNIFLSRYPREHTRLSLHKWVDDVTR